MVANGWILLCGVSILLFPPSITENLLDSDQYTKLILIKLAVQIEPLTVLMPTMTNMTSIAMKDVQIDNCSMILRRDSCAGPVISTRMLISWDTKICFQWNCRLHDYGMRVENCSTGSTIHPTFLLGRNGCSSETSMISSPTYDRTFSHAHSIGWLTVRLVGASFIRLNCAIRLCHLCDCATIAPPKNCTDYGIAHRNMELYDYSAMESYPDLCATQAEQTAFIDENESKDSVRGLNGNDSLLIIVLILVAKLALIFNEFNVSIILVP